MSSGENSLPPQQKMVRQIFLSCDLPAFFPPREAHKKGQSDTVCGDARWNLLPGMFLLCNSEFLILVFSRAEVQLQVYSLRSSPDHFEGHIAGRR